MKLPKFLNVCIWTGNHTERRLRKVEALLPGVQGHLSAYRICDRCNRLRAVTPRPRKAK